MQLRSSQKSKTVVKAESNEPVQKKRRIFEKSESEASSSTGEVVDIFNSELYSVLQSVSLFDEF